MAVMLRTLGVPARVAVGFTGGARRRAGARSVSTADAHAWVEAWFPGRRVDRRSIRRR
jgi:transglutaminase-like putative cysteine protease